jgi:putative PIN family toxin of toxin-antitoxin system
VKVVLDTNALLRSISRKSSFAIVLEKLLAGDFELYITTEILLEYEEKIGTIFSKETSELIIAGLLLLSNVRKIDIHFQLSLIGIDADDNKFVDCAFAGNVNFIVTDDKHFNTLKTIGFPQLNVISLDEFKELLEGN